MRDIELLCGTIVGMVRSDAADLTARQLAVFLTCYLEADLQTVRGLAEALRVAKPAITRAIDRLEELGLLRRKVDPDDRRSVLLAQTAKGNAFLRAVRLIMQRAAAEAATMAGEQHGVEAGARQQRKPE